MRGGLRRLRLNALPVAQTALGAGLAWAVATSPLIGHERPFFAPIAATISLGVSLGQRLRRVTELVVGVAIGVLVGDLLIRLIGTGVWQIMAVVGLATGTAVLLGGGAVIVTQAASSAVLVATLLPPGAERLVDLDRFVDALVGGLVGLAVAAGLLPLNPVTAASRHVDPVLLALAGVLDDVSRALAGRDRAAAAAALTRARGTAGHVEAMHRALDAAAEIATIAPARWRARGRLGGYLDAAEPLDHAVRDLRVLARHATAALRRDEPVPPGLAQALAELATAARMLREELRDGTDPARARAAALAAARHATEALRQTGGLAGHVVVGQARSLALDLLRATGTDRERALMLMPELPGAPPDLSL